MHLDSSIAHSPCQMHVRLLCVGSLHHFNRYELKQYYLICVTRRNSFQLIGTFVLQSTLLRIPFPIVCLVDDLRLLGMYVLCYWIQ